MGKNLERVRDYKGGLGGYIGLTRGFCVRKGYGEGGFVQK